MRPPHMVRGRPCITASCAGPRGTCGARRSRRCRAQADHPALSCSAPRTPRRTAARPEVKGGGRASHRALARRAHDQDPLRRRRTRTTSRHPADARPSAATPASRRPSSAILWLRRCASPMRPYDSDGLRAFLIERGTKPVHSQQSDPQAPPPLRWCSLEHALFRRKHSRRLSGSWRIPWVGRAREGRPAFARWPRRCGLRPCGSGA